MERKLKCLLLSERIQSEKATCCMIPIMLYFGKGETLGTAKRSIARAEWEGRDE